ncbi:hypothetical protein EMPS_03832 [Entomortierella parvispora]|uniref:Uncharacterized protein n=1 Tax=Entomortierella parvispora TaxID=205924 RepID=A0A9P3LUY9_9FUNG|nr:hypothetical protein EMPS_03832 [Entomortierella parvispora]
MPPPNLPPTLPPWQLRSYLLPRNYLTKIDSSRSYRTKPLRATFDLDKWSTRVTEQPLSYNTRNFRISTQQSHKNTSSTLSSLQDITSFDWNDYHYTDGMVYKAPPVLEHQGVTLPELARKHEQDLAKIQGHMANSTRLFDTLVDEILTYEMDADELAKHVISFVNTARILVSNDASKISLMRKDIYLRHLELPTSEPQENAILTLEDLAKRRTTVDLVSKTYTKPSVKESKRPLHKKPGFKKKQPEDSDKKSTHEKSKESTNSRDGGGRNNRPYKARKSSNYDDNKSAGDKGNGSEKERQ